MFRNIFWYELKYWLKKPSIYLYLIVFTGIAFLSVIGTAGLFDPVPTSKKIERLVNSPFEVNYMLQYFGKLMLFLLPAIIGATIYKDYKNNTHSVLYSYPIKKSDYLYGKFFSGLLLVFIIAFCAGLAMIAAEHVPGLHETKIGTFNIYGYLQALFIFILPNLLFHGAIVFAVVTYFRNIYVGFVVLIILFFIQNITENMFSGQLIALLDPFGQNAVIYETQLWPLHDKNNLMIPVLGAVLYNRLIWLTISSIIFIYTYKKFAFEELPITSLLKKKTNKNKTKQPIKRLLNLSFPKVEYDFSKKEQLKYSWLLSNVNFLTIIKSWMFYIIIAFGILALLFAVGKVTNNSEMTILPVTNIILTIPAFFFTTIIMLLTFIYSGMLVHKDQNSSMNQLVDATPISNFALLASKVIAIIKMQALLLLVMMLSGIIIQIYNNFYHFEIGLYLFHLFIVQFSGLVIWALASIFVHSIIRNTYLGIFILLLGWFGISGLKEIGIKTRLLLFNFSEPMQYSDLNGYGHLLQSYLLVKFYWLAFAFLLIIIAYLIWHRGINESFKERIISSKQNLTKGAKIALGISLIGFLISGFSIYSEEQKSVELSSKERNKAFAKFETDYAKYATIENQPKITDINLNIDIYPESNTLNIIGNYTLVNTSKKAIDTLLVKTGFDETTDFSISKPSKIIDEDAYVKFSVLKLKNSLLPNDSLQLSFTLKNKENTLFENNSNVLNNGTFFKNDILPRIGYFLNSSNKSPTDSTAKNKHYYSQDSDAINLKTVISTLKNQTAIAPGYLVKHWKENDRNYFEFETDSKIKNSLSFSSGDFEIEKEIYKGINLEIYHNKNHKYNLKSMKDGLKAALNYNTKYFGDYQFSEARIVEFPITEGTYASVMANSIPTSEMRFIANSTNHDKFDISFYTIAHELTHQWWGNQLVPADAFGAIMLSESITEYLSLKIFEQQFGKEKALEFLKIQHERYLKGRTGETNSEPPLYLVKSGQQYLAYGKGTIAFNTLSHYLGKEKLHQILKEFLNDYKFKYAPYPTSIDLLNTIKKHTPEPFQYIVKDYFENITFHEVKLNSVAYDDNTVEIDFKYLKNTNDYSVKTFNDFLEIGFFDEKNKLLKIETIGVKSIENKVKLKTKNKPSKVVIDPNFLLIEKSIEDNYYEFN